MANHLEVVHGPLGELSVLPCACPRLADHPRPTSARRLPPATDAASHRADAPPAGRHLRGRPRLDVAPRLTRARHAA
ncbi:MAG TPA: hypothetical protein VFR16_01590 [Agromyces mariniharenae]|nr:hypothetical protein [Agromyces mariniharenae]